MENIALTGRFKCPKCNSGSLGQYKTWYKKIIEKTEKYQIWTAAYYREPPLFQTVEEINKKNLKCSKCGYKPHTFVEFLTEGEKINYDPQIINKFNKIKENNQIYL